jgi:hypothetical protein
MNERQKRKAQRKKRYLATDNALTVAEASARFKIPQKAQQPQKTASEDQVVDRPQNRPAERVAEAVVDHVISETNQLFSRAANGITCYICMGRDHKAAECKKYR